MHDTDDHPTTTTPRSTDRATAAMASTSDEEGSLVTEYGLVTVIGATIAGLVLRWASQGAVTELLGAVLARVRALVGV
jgi:hypothetical protein